MAERLSGQWQKNVGPYNSYFYNNSIYVAANIVPKIAISSSASGILIANNIFYFEQPAAVIAGDQKKVEIEEQQVNHVLCSNNLFLQANHWPASLTVQDKAPVIGNPQFAQKGGTNAADYVPAAKQLIRNKGIQIPYLPNDRIGLRIGLKVDKDILGNSIQGLPDLGASEWTEKH